MAEKRETIISLVSEKQCVRDIAGANKHTKDARIALATNVLAELERKIQDALAQ